MDDAPAQDSVEDSLDLSELRDLLILLKDMRVQVFTKGNLSIGFKDDEPRGYTVSSVKGLQTEDDSDEHEVTGFTPAEGGFRDPRLWPRQGGQPLSFTG